MKKFMKNESGRKGLMIYYDMLEQFELLSKEELGELIFAIMRYSRDGDEPEIENPAVKMIFSFMKRFDDSDRERYERIREQRREAGIKSGEARRVG